MASVEFEELLRSLRGQVDEEIPGIESLRAGMELAATTYAPAEDVLWESVNDAGVRGEWVATAATDPSRTILYLHGGLHVAGSPRTHRELVSRIARSSGALAFVPDYRLAPEHPFPAALEDAYAAYRWLLGRGADPAATCFVGDEAGADLALTTVAALRDAGEPMPAALVCLSPWADLRPSGAARRARIALDPIIRPELLDEAAAVYLGGADPTGPMTCALATDLRGFPPLLVQVGGAEVLLDDAERLVRRARDAGASAEQETWTEMIHVWQRHAAILPEGREALARVGSFVRARAAKDS